MTQPFSFAMMSLILSSFSLVGCQGDQQAVENGKPSEFAHASEQEEAITTDSKSAQSLSDSPVKLVLAHIPNAIRIHDRVISGGQPEGEAGFRELQELGVKTIISVDGARPDVAMAKKYGLQYVHLPHGYNGISVERTKELAKAVRDSEGPIYIHCHHGKHRSPAAAAVACVSTGLIKPTAALGILKMAGTSESYRGLFQTAESARRLDDAMLDDLKADFNEIAKLPPMADVMVTIEHTYDQLKQLSVFGWRSAPDHPDNEPAHTALLLKEHFTEMLRMEIVAKESLAYQQLVRNSESVASDLETGLRHWDEAKDVQRVPAEIIEAFDRISSNCVSCHRQFRDLPLDLTK